MIKTVPIRFFIVAIILASCQKIGTPTVKIITPYNEQEFNSGETIYISADLYDADAMDSEFLTVTNANGNDTIINFKDNGFGPTYHMNKSFVGQPNTRYKIVISGFAEGTLTTDSLFVNSN
jgi:hypothetical protein